MVAVPGNIPVTTPPTLMLTALPLPAPALHIPPLVVLLKVVVWPTHTFDDPVIAAGAVLTVTVVVAMQPAGGV